MSEKQSLRAAARHAAWRRLVERHPAEFDILYEEEREKRGLPPKTISREFEYLQHRVRQLEAELGVHS